MSLVDHFKAVADDGEEFTVVMTREMHVTRLLNGEETRRLGLPEFRLDDGRMLRQIDAQTFQILGTDKIIRKVG